ncbi:hypothetical protein [Natrialba sp. PRR66]|uniref:hypothetical protein n=1 Tax=Natrialba sp. PRR66 TaxID=3098146 RepID=UPI002B1D6732|nr:hypothetical protein [Natrialba sp. PRR66]
MEILKIVDDSDPQRDLPPEIPEGASIAPKESSEEELREARDTRLEESLNPIEEAEADTETEDNGSTSSW